MSHVFSSQEESRLKEGLVAFWKTRGLLSEGVEIGIAPFDNGGDVLCVNFLPSKDMLTEDFCKIKEMFRSLVVFLAGRGVLSGVRTLQSAVNWRIDGDCRVLVKFACDSSSLEKILQRLRSWLKPLSSMTFDEMVSCCRFNGMPLLGYAEWNYVAEEAEGGDFDLRLYRNGEVKYSSRVHGYGDLLPVASPAILLSEAARMEYDIQSLESDRLYGFGPVRDGEGGVATGFAASGSQNARLRCFLVKRAISLAAFSDDGCGVPGTNVEELFSVLTIEKIRVLAVKMHSNGGGAKDGDVKVVWKASDLSSPTAKSVAAGLKDALEAMRSFDLTKPDAVFSFVFDCRHIQSCTNIPS